jgi:hypothetical protein
MLKLKLQEERGITSTFGERIKRLEKPSRKQQAEGCLAKARSF